MYYNTARLAYELRLHQSHVQRLIKNGSIERPEVLLSGIGSRPPQAGYSMDAIKRIVARWKRTH